MKSLWAETLLVTKSSQATLSRHKAVMKSPTPFHDQLFPSLSSSVSLYTRLFRDFFSSFPAQGWSSRCSGVLLGTWLRPRSFQIPGAQSLLFTLLRMGFQTVVCCVLGTWFEGGGFAHFLSGGVIRAQGWTYSTLSGRRKISVFIRSPHNSTTHN